MKDKISLYYKETLGIDIIDIFGEANIHYVERTSADGNTCSIYADRSISTNATKALFETLPDVVANRNRLSFETIFLCPYQDNITVEFRFCEIAIWDRNIRKKSKEGVYANGKGSDGVLFFPKYSERVYVRGVFYYKDRNHQFKGFTDELGYPELRCINNDKTSFSEGFEKTNPEWKMSRINFEPVVSREDYFQIMLNN